MYMYLYVYMYMYYNTCTVHIFSRILMQQLKLEGMEKNILLAKEQEAAYLEEG